MVCLPFSSSSTLEAMQKLKNKKYGSEELKSRHRKCWAQQIGSVLLWRAIAGRDEEVCMCKHGDWLRGRTFELHSFLAVPHCWPRCPPTPSVLMEEQPHLPRTTGVSMVTSEMFKTKQAELLTSIKPCPLLLLHLLP